MFPLCSTGSRTMNGSMNLRSMDQQHNSWTKKRRGNQNKRQKGKYQSIPGTERRKRHSWVMRYSKPENTQVLCCISAYRFIEHFWNLLIKLQREPSPPVPALQRKQTNLVASRPRSVLSQLSSRTVSQSVILGCIFFHIQDVMMKNVQCNLHDRSAQCQHRTIKQSLWKYPSSKVRQSLKKSNPWLLVTHKSAI